MSPIAKESRLQVDGYGDGGVMIFDGIGVGLENIILNVDILFLHEVTIIAVDTDKEFFGKIRHKA